MKKKDFDPFTIPPIIPKGGLLSLDWGEKKIGVATCDEFGISITPQKMFARSLKGKDIWELEASDIKFLTQLVEEFSPGALVLGWPKNVGSKETLGSQGAESLAAKLFCQFEMSVYLIEETLSSWEAKSFLSELSKKEAKKLSEDSLAAAQLLKSFLSRSRSL